LICSHTGRHGGVAYLFSARIAGRRRQSLGAEKSGEVGRQQADGNGGAQADHELRSPQYPWTGRPFSEPEHSWIGGSSRTAIHPIATQLAQMLAFCG